MTKREQLNLVSKITNPQGVIVLVTTDQEEPKGMTLADWLKQADAPKDGPTIDDEPRHSSGIMRPRDEDGRPD